MEAITVSAGEARFISSDGIDQLLLLAKKDSSEFGVGWLCGPQEGGRVGASGSLLQPLKAGLCTRQTPIEVHVLGPGEEDKAEVPGGAYESALVRRGCLVVELT